MTTARNWTQRIFEPGTTFLIRDQVAQNPGFQVSNNRRAAAYAGDVAGSMILAPLLASTATQIGAGLYNTAAPEALDISAESLANLAALGAMGYGIHRGIARFRNAGSWDGFMGKFADREPIATPGPRPGPDTGPVSVNGPGPQGPVPWGDSPIYARSIIIEDGTLPVPQRSVMLDDDFSVYDDVYGPYDPGPLLNVPPPFVGFQSLRNPGGIARSAEPMVIDVLTQLPVNPAPASIPSFVSPLTLASFRNNPYSSENFNF